MGLIRSLSGRLLLVTIAVVMLTEIAIFVPSVARFRVDYLLERVHRVKDSDDLFTTCFPGVERSVMQAEWLRFVRALKLDS